MRFDGPSGEDIRQFKNGLITVVVTAFTCAPSMGIQPRQWEREGRDRAGRLKAPQRMWGASRSLRFKASIKGRTCA